MHIYPYAVSRSQLERVIKTMRLPAKVTKNMDEADALMLLQSYRKHRKITDAAEARQMPVFIVRSNNIYQIQKTLRQVMQLDPATNEEEEMFREMDLGEDPEKMLYPDF
jgi:antitoxin component of RelBE/YafQ-DinJ toxin-antitoxin module